MSVATMQPSASLRLYDAAFRSLFGVKDRFDRALVRYDAWFLVFTAVILGLGATITAGLAIWCVVKKGKRFTGDWSFKNFGLKVRFECK